MRHRYTRLYYAGKRVKIGNNFKIAIFLNNKKIMMKESEEICYGIDNQTT